MGQALYRKYRSKSFSDLIGQEHVTKTLQNALKSGKLSHAYLLTGPRGVGKTSVARILAHSVNNLSYEDDSTHLDIIEIDAASNRRIDEIRDLREKVHTAPTSAKYKVYIIDEVHMLTREAFNALLKTLEEPPSHVIFILATTEAHKLPETIVSRTQRFSFKPIGGKEAVEQLLKIAKQEKISIEPEAARLIVEHGEGSFRDSIGILDQLSSLGKKVDTAEVRQFLGLPPEESIKALASAISDANSQAVVEIIIELREQGVSAPKIASQLSASLRQKIIGGDNAPWLANLLRQLLLVAGSPSPYDQLEISLLEAAGSVTLSTTLIVADKPLSGLTTETPTAKTKKVSANNSNSSPSISKMAQLDASSWPLVVESVKLAAPSVYTALRLATPLFQHDSLTLVFQFPLHQKKISQASNIEVIGKIIEELTGNKLMIKAIVDKSLKDSAAEPQPTDRKKVEPINSISNIFGGAEVLES